MHSRTGITGQILVNRTPADSLKQKTPLYCFCITLSYILTIVLLKKKIRTKQRVSNANFKTS